MPKKKVKIEGLPVYQKGGKTTPAPIYVDNINDPRYRAYQDSLEAYTTGEKYIRLNKLYGQNGEYYKTPHKPAGRKHIEGMSIGEENLPENYYSAKGLPIADISAYYNHKIIEDDNGTKIDYKNVQNNNIPINIEKDYGMNQVNKWSDVFKKFKTKPEYVNVVPDKEAYLFLPKYKQPVQPVKLGIGEINKLNNEAQSQPYQPQQVQVPPYIPVIKPDGWYSNKIGVPVDADNVDALYNEDGTRKYQNGGHTMKRKVTIVEIPKMANGGWAAQVHGGLNLPYPMSFNAKQQRVSDPEFNMKKSLSPVPREQSDIEAEKGEHILGDFDGDGAPESMAVGGKRHSEGGTPLSVPDNSFVFSDTQRLKIKDPNILSVFDASKPQTPGKLAKKYPLNDFKSMMEDPKTDPLSRKTAEMMYGNNMKKLQQLAEAQEMIKASKGIPASPQHMATGGPSGANINMPGGQFRFDLPVSVEQGYDMVYKPEAVAMANILYGPSATGNFQDNMNGPRTQFVRQWQTPTPNNLQQGSQMDNLGTTPPQQMPVGQPYAPQMTNIPSSLMPGTMDKGTGKGDKRKVRIEGLSADAVEDMALGLKALNTKKYTPWEPAVQVVKPSLLLESDQPIRNVLAENANTITNAMYSGNSRIGRAAAQGAMGELLKSSIGAAGEVSNRNQLTSNKYNELLANINNQSLLAERERMKRLYDGNVISDQQYRNAQNALGAELADRYRQREDKTAYREWQNKTSPYFMTDKRGRPVFKSAEAEAAFTNDMKGLERGTGMSEGQTIKTIREQYIAAGGDPEDARDFADDWYRKKVGLNNRSSTTTKTGNTTTKDVKGKYGGLLASRRL